MQILEHLEIPAKLETLFQLIIVLALGHLKKNLTGLSNAWISVCEVTK
jgi:hypothetical protein